MELVPFIPPGKAGEGTSFSSTVNVYCVDTNKTPRSEYTLSSRTESQSYDAASYDLEAQSKQYEIRRELEVGCGSISEEDL